MMLQNMQALPGRGKLQHGNPFPALPQRAVVTKLLPVERPSAVFSWAWKKKWPEVPLQTKSQDAAKGLSQWSGTWTDMTEKQLPRQSREERCENGPNTGKYLSPVNTHQCMTSAEQDFHHVEDLLCIQVHLVLLYFTLLCFTDIVFFTN